jgi:hypothetical protein
MAKTRVTWLKVGTKEELYKQGNMLLMFLVAFHVTTHGSILSIS